MLAQISLLSLFAVLAFVSSGDQGDDQWSIEYDVYQEGPRTVFEGVANLFLTEQNKFPCLSYCFDLPEGRLSGPSISSNPGEPSLPFDWWLVEGDEIEVVWCRSQLPLHPFTGEDMQSYPAQTPRNFKFYVIKEQFNGEDLAKLLDEWGPPRLIDAPWPESDYTLVSSWDLNADTMVDGADLAVLLAGWKTE